MNELKNVGDGFIFFFFSFSSMQTYLEEKRRIQETKRKERKRYPTERDDWAGLREKTDKKRSVGRSVNSSLYFSPQSLKCYRRRVFFYFCDIPWK